MLSVSLFSVLRFCSRSLWLKMFAFIYLNETDLILMTQLDVFVTKKDWEKSELKKFTWIKTW